jgi:hypothetical protein
VSYVVVSMPLSQASPLTAGQQPGRRAKVVVDRKRKNMSANSRANLWTRARLSQAFFNCHGHSLPSHPFRDDTKVEECFLRAVQGSQLSVVGIRQEMQTNAPAFIIRALPCPALHDRRLLLNLTTLSLLVEKQYLVRKAVYCVDQMPWYIVTSQRRATSADNFRAKTANLDARQRSWLFEFSRLCPCTSVLSAHTGSTPVQFEQSANVGLWCLENLDFSDVDVFVVRWKVISTQIVRQE